jgi:hypothetical protein
MLECKRLTCASAVIAGPGPSLIHAIAAIRHAAGAAQSCARVAEDRSRLVDWAAAVIHQLLAGRGAAQRSLAAICNQVTV